MPKTDWSARSSPEQRRPWLVPPDAKTDAGARTDRLKPAATTRGDGRVSAGGDQHKKHFVEPYPYTQTQRKAITQALATARLGDAMAREIFIGAIAYDLALLAAAQAEPAASAAGAEVAQGGAAPAKQPGADLSATEPAATVTAPAEAADAHALAHIAAQARALADALPKLDPAARTQLADRLTDTDPLARTYGTASIEALAAALAHLAVACTPTSVPAAQPEAMPTRASAPPAPAPSQRDSAADDAATLDFIRRAAQVYEQCFDARPAPASDAPFGTVLKAVADTTDISLALDDATLRRALRTG